MRKALALMAALLTFSAIYVLTWMIGQPEVLFFGLFVPAMVYSELAEH